ncbi:MAG: hypothetical protein N3C61_00885, partial [Candidatus Micrarchaeota archaeon]|nr:hypothetical protein [Candidatus Micrarchaeota archaeon]
IEELKRLWEEIKNIQQERGYKERNILISIKSLVMEMKEIRKKHTNDLLLRFYKNRGSEFILNEINEYLDSIRIYHNNSDMQNGDGELIKIYCDKIELFDAYFMLSQYVQIDEKYIYFLNVIDNLIKKMNKIKN